MKKHNLSLLLASALGLVSCNDKLEIGAPYENISVVYGLLDMSDTAHYIRIQKAYMDQNKSGIDMAKEADSNYYRNINVSIKELDATNKVINTISLSKVDLDAEGYSKSTGVFFNTPNVAYKFKHTLDPKYSYRLIILNNETGDIDSSETRVLSNGNGVLTSFGVREWLSPNLRISFNRIKDINDKNVSTSYDAIIPPYAAAAELVIRFNWIDSNITTGEITPHTADFNQFTTTYKITPSTTNSVTVPLSTENIRYYEFLSSVISKSSNTNIIRRFKACEMILFAADNEFVKYKELNATTGGLTADEIRPMYTNVKGGSMGLFSTRGHVSRQNVAIDTNTINALRVHDLTKDLNIQL